MRCFGFLQEPAAVDVGNGGDSGAAPAATVDAADATKDEACGSRKGSSAASDTKGEAREDGVTSQVLHNVENVSHKAMEGAKTFGSFLFSVANKAGKTVTETATKIKTTVEENVSALTFSQQTISSFLAYNFVPYVVSPLCDFLGTFSEWIPTTFSP